ncbi:MAG: hypothetical protein KKG33_01400 [candidate division Zixibacteria bacterium]|nr:hypothetical protein [candidate division Zixibacteria bacterium]MBU1469442.1 hypothetical protein [candidate division Zixibacteria bacterium]MBU2624196.1 hypothetical protein [candidate division Zixibacteria bacterium]
MNTRVRIVIAITVSLSAGFFGFCYFYPLLTVTGHRMMVCDKDVDIDFATLLDTTADVNLFRQPLQDYSEALLSRLPELSSVTCRIDLAGKVVCRGERKLPIALICLPETYGISSRCELLPFRQCGDVEALPLVTGIKIEKVESYAPVPSPKLKEALRFCKLLHNRYPELCSAISQIDFESSDAPVLILRNSETRIIIGCGDLDEKLSCLNLILDRLKNAPAGEFDMQYGRSIVARDLT